MTISLYISTLNKPKECLTSYLIAKPLDCIDNCLPQFFSEIGNIHIEFCVFFEYLVITSDLFNNLCSRYAPSFSLQKIFNNLKFFQGKFDFLTSLHDFFLILVQTKRFIFQNIFCTTSLR